MAWLNAGIPLLSALAVLVLAVRPVSNQALDAWALRFGLVLSERESKELAREHLRRERSARGMGASLGIIFAGIPLYLTVVSSDTVNSYPMDVVVSPWVTGTFLGALLSSIISLRIYKPSGTASLVVRTPERYLDGRLSQKLRAGTMATGALTAVCLGFGLGRYAVVLAGFVLCLSSYGVFSYGLKLIARRAALPNQGVLHILDGALRASDAHQIAGVTIAQWTSGAAMLVYEAAESVSAIRWLAVAVFWFGIFAWWTISRSASWLGLFDTVS